MTEFDRNKWNRKYADPNLANEEPSPSLVRLIEYLPKQGNALDLAGGAGRHSIWLAKYGLTVTLADVSSVGLECARQRAANSGVTISTVEVDLDPEDDEDLKGRDNLLSPNRWDLILLHYFDSRKIISLIRNALAPSGLLLIVQATERNLERNPKPPRPFILAEGEIRNLADGLEVLYCNEGWTPEGKHEAVLVARAASGDRKP
ncbi:MAG: class I SAM-dependent methyltransferase [Planctomycetales bacterium]|nr:class I SAM-dependent methyltransferase [Planctomycetales bacterium]